MQIGSFLKKDSGQLFKKSSTTFLVKVSGMFIGYLLTVIVTKKGGSEAWGQYMLAYSILQIVSIIAKFGVDTASIRFISEFFSKQETGKMKDFYYKAVSIVLVTSVILSIVLYFCSPFISNLVFHKSYMIPFFTISCNGSDPAKHN